jgi:hypothetical protein
VVEQNPPSSGQRQPVEHVIGDEVREIVALVRGAGNRRKGYAALLGDGQHEGQQRERRWIVHRRGDVAKRHAVKRPVHMIRGVDNGAAGAEQPRIDFITIDAAEAGVARQETDGGGASIKNHAHALVVILWRAKPD